MNLAMTQRQDLKLVMTSELRQAIEILQYTTYELEQFLIEQQTDNPLIELKEPAESFDDRQVASRPAGSSRNGMLPESWKSTGPLFRDELCALARMTFTDQDELDLVQMLILNLDDDGYLRLSYTDVRNQASISRGIRLLQKIGPAGIGARSLQECLLFQLEARNDEGPAAEIVRNHFDLLARNLWSQMSEKLCVPLQDVKRALDVIRSLTPKPCSFISDFKPDYVTPDVIVEESAGSLIFRLNDRHLPEIRMNPDYIPLLSSENEAFDYLTDQYRKFRWLQNSLEQRRSTIIKIVGVLLEKQLPFFMKGPCSLLPLTMKEVADEIGMHESTISRAVAGKIVRTPVGTFELRSLFGSKLATAGGDSVSQKKVKNLLRQLVDNENKSRPLSDQKLADHLKQDEGISVSRRTISKYREEMNIPSSSRRKQISV